MGTGIDAKVIDVLGRSFGTRWLTSAVLIHPPVGGTSSLVLLFSKHKSYAGTRVWLPVTTAKFSNCYGLSQNPLGASSLSQGRSTLFFLISYLYINVDSNHLKFVVGSTEFKTVPATILDHMLNV